MLVLPVIWRSRLDRMLSARKTLVAHCAKQVGRSCLVHPLTFHELKNHQETNSWFDPGNAIDVQVSQGNLEKSLLLPIADSLGVNVSESERERSGIIRRQFCGVR